MKLLFIIGLAAVCFTDVFAGPPIMVDACTIEAIALGVRQDDFHADPFTTEAERKAT
ncbi:MAG: hypothetical protein HQ511_01635 [Rhodospirillales bacterium]|nr:hypothetical protein [Rhodospirillales bacterium]